MPGKKEPSNKEEIPPLCRETFVSTSTGLIVVWTLAGLLLSCAGTAVGWAMSTSTSITELKGAQSALQEQINSKLDILIRKQEGKNE